MIGNTLKDWGHPGYGDNKPKIARRRLTESNNIDALPIDIYLKPIDLVIVIQDIARQAVVAFRERIHGTLKRALSLAPQQQNSIAQFV